MSGPSAHLSWEELACKDGTPYPAQWRTSRAALLARAFEALRRTIGQPLIVLSGYRTPEWNRRVGGAPQSQHVQGRALDLRPPSGWTVLEFAAVARDIEDVQGIGLYPTFLHLDVRPGPRLVVWHGVRREADTA